MNRVAAAGRAFAERVYRRAVIQQQVQGGAEARIAGIQCGLRPYVARRDVIEDDDVAGVLAASSRSRLASTCPISEIRSATIE
jgi:hypothetical protein